MRRKQMVLVLLMLAFTVTGLSACSKSDDKKTVPQSSDKKTESQSATETTAVPNVVGMSYLNAVLAIQKAGFYVKEKDSESFAAIKDKPVISQVPPSGTKARKKTHVDLVVK